MNSSRFWLLAFERCAKSAAQAVLLALGFSGEGPVNALEAFGELFEFL